MLGKFIARTPRRVYLDHAAATPLRPTVQAVMRNCERHHFANPSAIHREGVAARQVVDDAREQLARCLKVRSTHVTFTGSGTESNNIAIIGTLYARHRAGVPYQEMEIITTALEHPSVSEACAFATRLGVTVHQVPVDAGGRVVVSELETLLSKRTVLITLAYINSEIGVVQPLAKIARLARKTEDEYGSRIYVHADAAQAPYWKPCQFDVLGVDILSLDAAKCGGPKGVGVIAVRHTVELAPVLFGGPQEHGLRPATENTVAIVGASEAIVKAQAEYPSTSQRTVQLRDALLDALLQCDQVVLNGDREHRVANNLNLSIRGIDSEFLTVSLDEAGIAASTKSACSGASGGGSSVVAAIAGDTERAMSTLRLTLGPDTTEADIRFATRTITTVVKRLQATQHHLTQTS